MSAGLRGLIVAIGSRYGVPVVEELRNAGDVVASVSGRRDLPYELVVLVWLVEHTCSMAKEIEHLRARVARLEERAP